MLAQQKEYLRGHLLATCLCYQVGICANNVYHGRLSLVQRGIPTDFPILRFPRRGHMTPLSLHCMGQTYPYEGLTPSHKGKHTAH